MLLLFATTGVTLSKHYCMGRLMSVEINDHATGCSGDAEENMPCCENTSEELRVEDLVKSDHNIDLVISYDYLSVVAYVLRDVDPLEVVYPLVDGHSPPLIQRDLPVLLSSFLI